MMLSDWSIKDQLKYGSLEIEPLDIKTQLQPASVDLRLQNGMIINPGEFKLGTTVERVYVPDTLAAKVEGRSSWGRLGLAVHVTAGFIDPGFNGQITLEFLNVSDAVIRVPDQVRICQICFFMLTTPCQSPYAGKYQNQLGVTESRINEDV